MKPFNATMESLLARKPCDGTQWALWKGGGDSPRMVGNLEPWIFPTLDESSLYKVLELSLEQERIYKG